MKVLWVIDADSEHAALGLTLQAGNFADPDDVPGLMHLMEHTLFGGSKNFPEHGEILSVLEKQTGSINAWTSPEYTSFVLHSPGKHFSDAVLRFVDMLSKPLFTEKSIEAEIVAIDAEFRGKLKDENRRIQDVHKATCNQTHPFSRFSVGNAELFAQLSTKQLKQRLSDAHSALYKAKDMCVCIVLPPSLQNQIPSLEIALGTIQSGSEQSLNTDTASTCEINPQLKDMPLHTDAELNKFICIKPLKPIRHLQLSFDVSHYHENYKTKSDGLVSHLLGYEGPGSLLSFLQQCGWATQILVGAGLEGRHFREFNISLQLTEQGQQQLPNILTAIDFFIDSLRNNSELARHYDEKARLNRLAFDHQSASKASQYCQQLSINMHHYEQPNWLNGSYLMDGFDTRDLNEFLAQLNHERLRVVLVSPEVEPTKTTSLYKAKYSVEELPKFVTDPNLLSHLQKALSLPKKNAYIPSPSDHSIATDQIPTLSETSKLHKIYIGCNSLIEPDRAEAYWSMLSSDESVCSLSRMAFRKCWANHMQIQLNSEFYDASIAGCFFKIYAHQQGIGLHTSGFSSKQITLLHDVLHRSLSGITDEQQFTIYKTQYQQSQSNKLLNKPINLLFTYLQSFMVKGAYLPDDIASEMVGMDLHSLNREIERMLSESTVEGLFFGDWNRDILEQAISSLPFPKGSIAAGSHQSILKLQDIQETRFVLPEQNDDNALVLYMQGANDSLREQALMMLIESFLGGFYFNWMRTQKNLGYNIGSGYLPFNDYPGISLYVQSPQHDIDTLFCESRACIDAFMDWLAACPEKSWAQHNMHLKQQVLKHNVNLTVTCQRFWHSIGQQDNDFSRLSRLGDYITSFSPQTVIDELDKKLNQDRPFFILHTPSNYTELNDTTQVITDIYKYK